MKSWIRLRILGGSGLLILVLAGCQSQRPYTPLEGSTYLNPDADLSSVGRVALVELENLTSYPDVSENLSEALYVALQKRQYFGMITVAQADPRWKSLQSPLDANYSAEQLMEMRRVLQCDAILTGAVTQYEPYPHMSVGVRIRLIDLRSGELLWGAEAVWDCGDYHTKLGIRNYLRQELGSGPNPLRQNIFTTSPLNFFKFVSYELAQTLKG